MGRRMRIESGSVWGGEVKAARPTASVSPSGKIAQFAHIAWMFSSEQYSPLILETVP
jgi:hypothetical protein